MMKRKISLTLFLICTSLWLSAQLRLPTLVADGMVLQRDQPVKIWGWDKPNENIVVTFNNATYQTTSSADSSWVVTIPSMKAGGPYSITVADSQSSITINNVLFGDVWLCSGQSNMELNMQRVSPLYPEELQSANNDLIRYFQVPKTYYFKNPKKDLPKASWVAVSPENIASMSAVSYFFGKALQNHLNVPIGLINSALGGSPIQSWMSEESLKEFPEYYAEAIRFKSDSLIQAIENKDKQNSIDWYAAMNQQDAGLSDPNQSWYAPNLDDQSWDEMEIPGYWADAKLGQTNGVVWFRKHFDVPLSMVNQATKLELGTIVDADSVFINDVFVGTTSYQYPPRRYKVPANVLKSKNNLISIRVINERGRGGFTPNKAYELQNDTDTVLLSGTWKYKLGVKLPPLPYQTFIRWKAQGLHNAMIAPLTNYAIKGVIWYQGESNAGKPEEYEFLLKTMITDWRQKWNDESLPFIVAQLPNFMKAYDKPTSSGWARMRESQASVTDLPCTGYSVNIDLGEWNDIHPLNKKDVGDRLALIARKVAYAEKNTIGYGPIFKSMKIKGDKIILSFDHVEDGFVTKADDTPQGFAIAGEDQQFFWADAKIKKDKIILSSNDVSNPIAVRYAWADNPDKANVYNSAMLPLAPFRTDDWAQ